MRVRVLGGLAVDGVAERELGSRKARTLLKVLAVARGSAVTVERLVDILWAGDAQQMPARPADQVGVLVSRLRSVVGADRLVRGDAGYALRADWLDLDELDARVREAAEALDANRLGAARAAAQAAKALAARGRVLPEEDGEWVDVERTAADALVGSARRIAAEAASRAGDQLAAVAAAEEALAHDPYDEAALRILMLAHAAAGRPASALAAYVRVRDRLVDDLGVSPTAETEVVHDAIVLDDASSVTAITAATATALPGRARELAALDDALDRAAAGLTVTVVVTGEAGIGKTTLVDHWLARLGDRAFALVGRCDPLGRDLPLQPVGDAVVQRLADHGPAERAAALAGDGSVLGPLLGIESEPPAAGGAAVLGDLGVGRARLFASLLALIGRMAGERVAVVVVEDLHAAGDSTLAWLRFASRRPSRLVVVTTSRAATDPPFESAIAVDLGPIDLDATAAIVGAERAAELHERSGGHPLLLAALASGSGSDIDEVIARRMESVGEAAATVRAAAVLGAEIDLDLLADVLDVPAVAVLEHVETAAAAGLLVERGAGFAFRHDVEREALADSMGAARRALVHRGAARALAGRRDADPLVVAVHARLGGDDALAVDHYTRAADVALARYDTAAAETLVDAALALGDSPAAYATRARLHLATSRIDEAAEDARRAISSGGGAVAFAVAGWVAYYRRRYDEALGFADAAVERAVDPAVQVSGLALAGRVRHGTGALGEAAADFERATAMDAPAEVRALAAVWLAQARTHQGRPADALQLLDRALVDPDRLAHPFAPLHGLFARVLALGQIGRAAEALRACDDLDALVERSGETGARMVGPAANVRAWLLRWTGRTEEADDRNRIGLAAHDPLGPRGEAHYAGMLDLADGRLLAGDDAGAADLVERMGGIESWNGTMAWHQRHRWKLVRARLALRDGDAATAAELCADVASDAAARGARRYELFALGIGALAGDATASDAERIDVVITGLRACAGLDGQQLVGQLIRLRDG